MTSEHNVIELGSSEDEQEPPPKKKKPLPNAMVHIPNKFSEITIKPTKSAVPKCSSKPILPAKFKVPAGGKLGMLPQLKVHPFCQNNKVNNVTLTSRKLLNPVSTKNFTTTQSNLTSNLLRKLSNSQIQINKIPSEPHKSKNHFLVVKHMNDLLPMVTIKKQCRKQKRPIELSHNSQLAEITKRKIPIEKPNAIVQTVNLDDDDDDLCDVASASSVGPQWYLRPEDQTAESSLQNVNNKEPEPSNLIEITIEDSPVKSMLDKRCCEIGTEFAITIEDSPVKLSTTITNNSRSEENTTSICSKQNFVQQHYSKKKLTYPNNKAVVEIEIGPIAIDENLANQQNKCTVVCEASENQGQENKLIEVEINSMESGDNNFVQDIRDPQVQQDIKDNQVDSESIETGTEFHPVYQDFIDLCFKLENSADMEKIVEKKIKTYYRQVPKDYVDSEEFIEMVSSKTLAMKAGPDKMYLYIKDIVDELNVQRKIAKAGVKGEEVKEKEAEVNWYEQSSAFTTKRQRQIRKLEKTLKKLHRAIQKLEEQEVDFDDEEDSVYLLTERYKERMVKVHAKFCQLTKTKMPSQPRIYIQARPGRPAGPAKRLEKWINKKVPLGTPLTFPDFHDVVSCVREANSEDILGWNEADIIDEARDLFTRCGKQLQRRRQENEWRLAASRILFEEDPADTSQELKSKLEENRKNAAKREIAVLNKYAEKQNQLNLKAVEIGEKEVDESPVESEDDDQQDESNSLHNKVKRKKRLQRLLSEKTKSVAIIANDDNSRQYVKIAAETNILNANVELKNNVSENNVLNIDNVELNKDCDENETFKECINPTTLVSDESKVESDIDELHLLQKLHSGNEITSTDNESSYETPIAISDSLESNSDVDKQQPEVDVVSIEDSSYSESEKDDSALQKTDNELRPYEDSVEKEIVCPNKKVCADHRLEDNNKGINDLVEGVLLASSDEENLENKNLNKGIPNLRDDPLLVGVTLEKVPSGTLQIKPIIPIDSKVKTNVKVIENTAIVGDSFCDSAENKETEDNHSQTFLGNMPLDDSVIPIEVQSSEEIIYQGNADDNTDIAASSSGTVIETNIENAISAAH